ncbi:MAG: Mur ligase family protein, partial [Alkalibacterium sp.]|nr:Mur ligase family protein [Alkalibacterium sp.]
MLLQNIKHIKRSGTSITIWAFPSTLLEMDPDTEVVVLEMGMSEKGEIHASSEIAEPDIAVITMIGESHIEFTGFPGKPLLKQNWKCVEGMTPGNAHLSWRRTATEENRQRL